LCELAGEALLDASFGWLLLHALFRVHFFFLTNEQKNRLQQARMSRWVEEFSWAKTPVPMSLYRSSQSGLQVLFADVPGFYLVTLECLFEV
jgi:hypothetical protein